jgi:hypothetical protein
MTLPRGYVDLTNLKKDTDMAPHGSPRDRGESDQFYGREFRPHKWLDGLGKTVVYDLTPEELEQYRLGYSDLSMKKDW